MKRLTPRSASFLLRLASTVIVSTGALPCVADPRGAGAAPGSSDQLRPRVNQSQCDGENSGPQFAARLKRGKFRVAE